MSLLGSRNGRIKEGEKCFFSRFFVCVSGLASCFAGVVFLVFDWFFCFV